MAEIVYEAFVIVGLRYILGELNLMYHHETTIILNTSIVS